MEPARKHLNSGPGVAAQSHSHGASGTVPILLTGGDPAGVAPETLLALVADIAAQSAGDDRFALLYFATAGGEHIQSFAKRCADHNLRTTIWTAPPPAAAAIPEGVSILDVRGLRPDANGFEARAGRPDREGGTLAFAALEAACDFATTRPARGIVTAPLSKEWVARGGRPDFRGHTEYLAMRFGRDVLMLMHGRSFSVIPLTVHIAIAEVPQALRVRLADPALPELLEDVLRRPAYSGARLAMCGLNPHCGDGGLFGTEDQEFIAEWCQAQRNRGIPLDGPLPADTLFTDGVRAKYRLILSCYHDQGLIPFKALEGHAGINATIGLPIPRTSPDHGTAFDIAGTGRAQPESLRAALRAIAGGELTG